MGACCDRIVDIYRKNGYGPEVRTERETSAASIPCPYSVVHEPAFDLIGFTQIVHTSAELFEETRTNGRWDLLRQMATVDGRIYGLAMKDTGFPPYQYRYTMAVMRAPGAEGAGSPADMITCHVKESDWLVFELGPETDGFWQRDPYKMARELGYEFNTELNLNCDVYPITHAKDDRQFINMEFWLPVKRLTDDA